ncbi:hypothetical protein [Saccharopolyspora aridisoli]|uniref:hypothetical protein n=1 Tax=Saccharopolyspora aridisoli TaxID=2530385 RepID=UPI001404F549|nr:hypothetical protein [Saccharopolyspora aridisoli]
MGYHQDDADIDLATMSRALRAGTNVLEAPSLPQSLRESSSLPLLLAIRAAALR